MCEDSKSAPSYYRSLCDELRLTAVEVEIIGEECGSSPDVVVDYAAKQLKAMKKDPDGQQYDQIWCAIDVDRHPTLDAAISRAKALGIRIALSNPCFEYWVLLHWEKTDRPFKDCGEAVKAVRKYSPKYEKGTFNFGDLALFRDVACRHAAQFESSRPKMMTVRTKNSSTDVHRLVGALKGAAVLPYPAP